MPYLRLGAGTMFGLTHLQRMLRHHLFSVSSPLLFFFSLSQAAPDDEDGDGDVRENRLKRNVKHDFEIKGKVQTFPVPLPLSQGVPITSKRC